VPTEIIGGELGDGRAGEGGEEAQRAGQAVCEWPCESPRLWPSKVPASVS
jgi:hypothetical protein